MALIDQISNNVPNTQCSDTTAPPKLQVEVAEFGVVVEPNGTPPRDPFLLSLANVEPGTTIEIINLSEKPDADWQSDKKALGTTMLSTMPQRRLLVRMTDEEAAKMGIAPGDVIEVRQVDAAGNASEPVQLRLPNDDRVSQRSLQLPTVDGYVGNAPIEHNRFITIERAADSRQVVVLAANMSLGVNAASGKPELSGKRCLEPGAEVLVRNERTGGMWAAKVDERGSFSLPFEAELGDPITVWASDTHNPRVELGTLRYCPVLSPGQAQTRAAASEG